MYCNNNNIGTGLIPDPEVIQSSSESTIIIDDNTQCQETFTNNDDTKREPAVLHPLLQFKMHAVQNNEILLMVADMIATIISLRRQQIEIELLDKECKDENESPNNNNNIDNNNFNNLKDIIAPYLDFTLVPWWDVATKPYLIKPNGIMEASRLNILLRRMCNDSSLLLKKALWNIAETHIDNDNNCGSNSNNNNSTLFQKSFQIAMNECIIQYDIFSTTFFGKIIGSYEQNSMGIRGRHPLCRDVLECSKLRTNCHDDIIKCMDLVGMIGGGGCEDDNCDEDGCDDDEDNEDNEVLNGDGEVVDDDNVQQANTMLEKEEEKEEDYNYTVDDIAHFIANLEIDEDGQQQHSISQKQMNNKEEDGVDAEEEGTINNSKNDGDDNLNDTNDILTSEEEGEGDDLDALFSPLDGTAMYSNVCKMNHSCNPNILVRYSNSISGGNSKIGTRWGKQFPLVVQGIALRDIKEHDELCISYIQNDKCVAERQLELESYGFHCTCVKCELELDNNNNVINDSDGAVMQNELVMNGERFDENEVDEDDLFGDSDESSSLESCNSVDQEGDSVSGELYLSRRVDSLNKMASNFGQVPIEILGYEYSFILNAGREILQELRHDNEQTQTTHLKKYQGMDYWLEQSINAIQLRNYSNCIQFGSGGEELGITILHSKNGWPKMLYKDAYGICTLTSAIGHANNGLFIPALQLLDKLSILSLPRNKISEFFSYVEFYASKCSYFHGLDRSVCNLIVRDYKELYLQKFLEKDGLSLPMNNLIIEHASSSINAEMFDNTYLCCAKPIVIRDFAKMWPAVQKWR